MLASSDTTTIRVGTRRRPYRPLSLLLSLCAVYSMSTSVTYASAGPAPAAATNVGTTTTSTFSMHCPGVSTIPSIEWAIDTCHTKGGWLATPQSLDDDIMLRNLVTAVTGVSTDYLVIGGSDAWVEAHWVWVDGPEKGRLFWTGNLPNDNGKVIGHRYVPPKFYPEKDGTGSSGDFMIQFGSATNIIWGDVSHLGTTQCYACQYQRCSILCNTTHTASITGTWWPDCVCTCKPGWRGERCDIQFTSHCTADSSAIGSIAGSIADCRARGGYLASPRSRDDDDAIVSLGNVSNISFQLIDGTDEMKESFWRFADGPFKDELFWVGYGVADGGGPAQPAPWETAHYNNYYSLEPQAPTVGSTDNFTVLWERNISDTVASEFTWRNYRITTTYVQCHACQYAHCSQICNTTNTVLVSDTEWPACTCTCKAGWGGPRCSEKLIETPTSNISVRCPMEGGIPDLEWAIDRCHSYGGWLATPQRAEEYEAILAFANMYSDVAGWTNWTLLGGSDAWYETHWVWRDGPEIGRQFWLGNLPSYYQAGGTGHPIAGRYSPPLFLPEEANTGTGTPGDLMVFGPHPTYNYTVGDLGDGNWNISIIQCYACMFQLCSNVCNTTHTASFTGEVWPNCVCTCKPGWRGERCDIQFSTHCTADHSTIGGMAGPIADCRARGGHLASPQNHVQDDSLQSLGNISTVTFLVIGGSDEAEEGVWRWLDGPEKGEVFWRGYSPDTGYSPLPAYPWLAGNNTYANFAPNEPQAPPSPVSGNYIVYWETTLVSFMWGDDALNNSKASCYACQYTACVDYCNATTTASFTGLEWPSCSCTCLPGFAGPKCQCADQCHALGTLSTYLNYTDQSCGCVCAPNFGGTFCNITTATPTMTSTLPTTPFNTETVTKAATTTTLPLSYKVSATAHMTTTGTLSSISVKRSGIFSMSVLDLSDTHTASEVPMCPTHSPPCPYASSVSLLTHPEVATSSVDLNISSIGCAVGGGGLYVAVPFSLWSSSSAPVNIRVNLRTPLLDFFDNNTQLPASTGTAEGALKYKAIIVTDGSILWVDVGLVYVGPGSRSARTVTVKIPLLLQQYLSCRLHVSSDDIGIVVPIDVHLLDAPPTDDTLALKTVINVGVGVGVLSVVPSAVVRAGMMATIMGMLRCSEFDSQEEVGFVANPLGWAPGREELQYYRGSVILGLICIGVPLVIATALVVCVKVCSSGATSAWSDIFATLRLPAIPLVVVLLVSEVCVSSATSMIFYNGSQPTDVVLGLMSIVPLYVYMGVFLHNVWKCSRYIEIIPTPISSSEEVATKSLVSRLLRYVFEPTHDVIVLKPIHPDENDDDSGKKEIDNARWLRGNFYFVADRRWPVFGAIEAICGSLINMLEGIPMTTENRALCIARPACVCIISGGLLVLLLLKVPNAVRLQQLCSVMVMGGLTLASILATVNAVTPSEGLESATGYIGAVTIFASMVLGIIEMGVIVMTYFPNLREILSLRSRALEAVVARSKAINANAAALHVPLVAVRAPPTTPPPAVDATPPSRRHQPGADKIEIKHIPPQPRQPRRQPPPQPPVQQDNSDDDVGGNVMADGEDEIIRQILDDLDAYEMRVIDDHTTPKRGE